MIMIFLSSVTLAQNLPGKNQKIDLNLRAVDLKDAFRALADIADRNIITDSSVQGKVTVNLKDISFLEAVELLTKTNGLSYYISGNTVVISSNKNLESNFGKEVTKVFKLKNADPKEIKKSLSLLINDSSLRVDKRTNSLVITTYQNKLSKIERIITKLDKNKKQIILEARIEEISRNELEKLGVDWSNISDVDDPTDYAKMLHDKVETSVGDSENTNSSTFEAKMTNSNGEVKYTAVLEALETEGKANLLANPKVTTLDGKEAEIMIGTKVPLFETEKDDDTGTTTRTFDKYEEVGVKLSILPRVVKDEITVKVTPEVSTITSYKGEYNDVPVINTREAETNIRIKDGKTIALGGLIKEKELKKLSKVPIMGDIPILGKLFQTSESDIEKRELVIFITPRVIDDNGQADEEERSKEVTAQQVFKIQVGSFEQKQKAEQVVAELKKNGFASEVIEEDSYQVQLQKEFTAKKEAEKIASELEEKDFSTWIHRKDKKDE